jgi:hypothetical protein
VADSFQDGSIRWEQLFKNASRLDIFISYGHTWRNTLLERIDKLLANEDARLRVILPDPDDDEVLRNGGGSTVVRPEQRCAIPLPTACP